MLEFQVVYQKSEVLQALRYHFIRKPEVRVMIILVNVFALLSMVLFALGLASPLPFLTGTALWLSLMLAVWRWMPLAVYRRNRTFRDSFTVRLEDAHLFLSREGGSRTWAWREFTHYYETPAFFHLCFGEQGFLLLPKESMLGEGVVSRARRMISAGVPKR
jgi:hypothetical protein